MRNDEAREQVRQGARAWVARLRARSAEEAARAMPRVLLTGLCAGTLAPVAVAGLELPAVLAAAGVVGGVGVNLLTEVVSRALTAARERNRGEPPTTEQVETELAAELDKALRAGDQGAGELASALSRLLSGYGAAQEALAAAVELGDRRLLDELVHGFAAVGAELAEFAPLFDELRNASWDIQEILRRQDVEHHRDRRLAQEQSAMLAEALRRLNALSVRLTAHSPGEAPPTWINGSPYQGLAPFGMAETAIFYGRGEATRRLVELVAKQVIKEPEPVEPVVDQVKNEPGLVVVTGASGAGKSSLLGAGLRAEFTFGRVEGLPSVSSWPQLELTPGDDPLRALAVQLAAECAADADTLLRDLRRDPATAAARARDILAIGSPGQRRDGPRRVLVVVDQFEEVFTLLREDRRGDRKLFLDALQAIATSPGAADGEPAGVVVIAVRGDFMDRCAAYPELATALEKRMFVLGPMDGDELTRAITGPAAAAGLLVEDGLPEQVVRELAGYTRDTPGAGALPLLSLAMRRTWDNCENGRLTRQDYDRAGGVCRAVEAEAEGVYRRFTEKRREIAKRILLLLAAQVSETDVARQRVSYRTLVDACGPEHRSDVEHVLGAFTGKRLMVTGHTGPAEAGRAVELAHDVLLTAWPRLVRWLGEDRAERALHNKLVHDAQEWERDKRHASYLYQGVRLDTAREARARWQADPGRYPALPPFTMDFLEAGERAAVRNQRLRRGAYTALAGLIVLVLTAATAALRFGLESDHQRKQALSRHLSLLSEQSARDPATSARLAAAAWQFARTDEARVGLADVLGRPSRATFISSDNLLSATFSPDGKTLAATGKNATIQLWDVASRRPIAILKGHTAPVWSVVFSPDGRMLASGGDDKTLRLWDVAGRRSAAVLKGHTGSVFSVVYSPDGRTLASASADKTARLWDVAGRRSTAVLKGHTDTVSSVAFSPDGTTLASGGFDDKVRLWSLAALRQTDVFAGHTGGVWSVAFNPDGRTLASGSADKTVLLWDLAKRKTVAEYIGHTHIVHSVAFSRDGKVMASGGGEGKVRVWDTATRSLLGAPMEVHNDMVLSVAFSPDGRTLATASRDDTARLWDIGVGRPWGPPLSGHTGEVWAVAYSPEGRVLASGSADGTIRLWDAATREPIGDPLTGHGEQVMSLAFSPDGRILASSGFDDTVRLWDPAGGRQIGVLTGHTHNVLHLAFTPDGRALASAADDSTVRLWDVATHRQTAVLTDHKAGVQTVAFSPDGRTLASGAADGTTRLWDMTARRPTGVPLDDRTDGAVWSVAFAPDGRTLARAAADGTTRLWDVATRRPIGIPMSHSNDVLYLAFNPAGDVLATASGDATVRLWDVKIQRQIGDALAGHHESVLKMAFSPDGTTLATGGFDATLRLWRLSRTADPLADVCAIAHRPFTREEWTHLLPGEDYRAICPSAL
ncbi:NACHT and WD repeat domain-containing protein [Spongiactinospora sp. 9N601]|uniref:NACHT and WD repeat domain-containing protein n=1 Tax=Spongiactinospora sp. 9N601 TaxID=3375149 RepID=UPI0037BE17B3